MKRWAQEQAQEAAHKKLREKDADYAYADMLKAIDEIRGTAEEEEAKLRAEILKKIRDENLRV